MNETTWQRLVKVFGMGIGGILMWKTVKYFFGATVLFWVIAIIVSIKIVSSTYLGALEMMEKHEIERIRVRTSLEIKDKEAEREHDLKVHEFTLQQQREDNKRKTSEDMKRREAYEEVERKVLAFNESFYKDYHMLQLQEKVLSEWHAKGIGDNTYMNLLNLQQRMKRERPNENEAERGRERVKREILIAYGLMQDPLMREALKEEPRQEIQIIVPQPQPNPIQQYFTPEPSAQQMFNQRYGSSGNPTYRPQGAQGIIQQRAMQQRYGLRR